MFYYSSTEKYSEYCILARETNVVFLDDDDTDSSTREFYLTQPYSGGRAFTSSVLDLLMILSFFDPFLISVVEGLIFGPMSKDLENVLAEGTGLIGGDNNVDSSTEGGKYRTRIVQPSMAVLITALKLDIENKMPTYGQIFVALLQTQKTTSLGIFRLTNDGRKNHRFVMCNPPQDTVVRNDDLLIALRRN